MGATTATAGALVVRHVAQSGNRDADHFYARCGDCDHTGAMHSNRTVEGRELAERDALDHNRARHGRAA